MTENKQILSKVHLVSEQAEVLDRLVEQAWSRGDILESFHRPDEVEQYDLQALRTLTTDELVAALYCGYDVIPTYQPGDCVIGITDGAVYEVTSVDASNTLKVWLLMDNPNANIGYARGSTFTRKAHTVKRATIYQEFFARLGRNYLAFQAGDVLEPFDGPLIKVKIEIPYTFGETSPEGAGILVERGSISAIYPANSKVKVPENEEEKS